MKQFICCICVFILLFSFSSPVSAGDLPEAFSYNDNARVFIGTLQDFTVNNSTVTEVKVLPAKKIKGEVIVNEIQTYDSCYFVKNVPEIGKEYFFGWLSDNEIYAYEVKSRTEDKIQLKITDEFSERIQNYLDEGLYERAEIARVNVGRKITLSEYLETSRELAEKVTFSINGAEYDIDVEEFYDFSDNALITDVKNTGFRRLGNDDWVDDILYITVAHRQNTLIDGFPKTTFACVSRFCEVDRYSQMMGRLPNCDFTMAWEDLAKLYELLPFDVQKELYAKNEGNPIEVAPSVPKKTYTPWILGGCVSAIILLVVITYLIRKKKA